jgi:hypothetical protein
MPSAGEPAAPYSKAGDVAPPMWRTGPPSGARMLRRVARVVVLGLALATIAALAAHGSAAEHAAPPTTAQVARLAKPFLPQLRRSGVAVLLPTRLPLYADGLGGRGSFVLGVDAAKDCGGANACFVASFTGERAKTIPGRANIRLRGGFPALFVPVSCGASCAPASLFFRYRGSLYSWQAKDLRGNARATMVALANEALAAGAR